MKKLVVLLLVIALALSLAACGNSSQTPPSAAPSSEASAAASSGTVEMFADGWGDANTAFDPLAIEETWTFEEMRKNLGDIPASDSELLLAGNIRTYDNVLLEGTCRRLPGYGRQNCRKRKKSFYKYSVCIK